MKSDSPKLVEISQTTESTSSQKSTSKKWWMSLLILNCAAALCGCDEQLLPASLRALEVELNFYPMLMSFITLVQTLTLALSCPIWGYLADRFSHSNVMAVGVFSWGVFTTLLAFSTNSVQILLLRFFNGMFLGSIAPTSQTILANTIPAASLSAQFGIIQACTSVGKIIGGTVTTSVSELSLLNLSGWRWSFLIVGILSLILGVFVYCSRDIITEPIDYELGSTLKMYRSICSGYSRDKDNLKSCPQFFYSVLKNSIYKPTIILLTIEGILGTISWSALSFIFIFLQYCGLRNTLTGIAASASLVGSMICGPLGGYLADKLHVHYPYHARLFLGQLSTAIRVPIVYLIFIYTPREAEYFYLFAIASFVLGLFSLTGAVVNRPIFSEITRPNHRGTTFAIVIAIETAIGVVVGTGGVGFLIDYVFDYQHTNLPIEKIPDNIRLSNAASLGKAIFYLTAIPWGLSTIIYTILHFTYKKDKKKLQEEIRTAYVDIDDASVILENTVQNPFGVIY